MFYPFLIWSTYWLLNPLAWMHDMRPKEHKIIVKHLYPWSPNDTLNTEHWDSTHVDEYIDRYGNSPFDNQTDSL